MTALSGDLVLPLRMASLLLGGRLMATPHDVVTWFGAMQAQDLASGEWSFGVRLPGTTQLDIARATDERQILRTWPMRGTVHFVPPEDARWMVQVTGARALAGAASRRAALGLDEQTVNQAVDVLALALTGGRMLTRAECVSVLNEAGVETTGQRAYHLLWYAAHVGVTCMGPQAGKEQTFVLLDEWVPKPNAPTRDEALGMLALRYFRSHGPASRQDFAGWTGLTVADTRRGIEVAGDALVTVDVEGVPNVMSASLLDEAAEVLRAQTKDRLWLLSGFDEYMLGYKDRSRMVPSTLFRERIVPGGNGMFMPTMAVDGRAVGTWKREVKGKRVHITALPFEPLTKKLQAAFVEAGTRYAAYLELEPVFPA